jgi:hypothetical protein
LNDRAIEVFRTALTVVGILLLVVFGSRAAAQARNMKLAGANHKSVFAVGTDIMNILGFGKTQTVKFYEAKPLAYNLPSQIHTATTIATTDETSTGITGGNTSQSPVNSAGNAQSQTNNGLHKAAVTVNGVTDNAQQVVNNVTKNNSNDFLSLWP